jgi:nucleotide-binding universal stress UspA family protein
MSIVIPEADGEAHEHRDPNGRLVGLTRREGSRDSGGPRLLVALDGSPTSTRVVAELLRWRRDYGWRFEVHLANVQMFFAKEAAETHLVQIADADTAALRATLRDAGIGYVFHVAMGPPADRLIELAEALAAQQIVMGTRGHGALGGALLGSVAYKVVHRAEVPVTLIR